MSPNDVGAARRDGARRAVIVLLAIVVGALCGLMVVGLHRAGVSLPFWDARSTGQKYADAWRSEASRLTWPGSPPAFSPPPSNVDSSVVGTAVTYLDASWLCDWGRVWVANHSSRPARAALAVKTLTNPKFSDAVERVDIGSYIRALARGNDQPFLRYARANCVD